MSIILIQVLKNVVWTRQHLWARLGSCANSLQLPWCFCEFRSGEVVSSVHRTGILVALFPNLMILWYYIPMQILGKTGDKAHTGQDGSKWLSFHCWYGPFGRRFSRRRLDFLSSFSGTAAAFVSTGLNPSVVLWMLEKNVYFCVTYTLFQLSFSTKNQTAIFMPPGVWLSFRLTNAHWNNTIYPSVQLQIWACVLFGKGSMCWCAVC